MSRIRIYRWGDPDIPVGWMALFREPRQWLGYAAAGWRLNVSWVNRLEVQLDDGSLLIAGDDEELKLKPETDDVGA